MLQLWIRGEGEADYVKRCLVGGTFFANTGTSFWSQFPRTTSFERDRRSPLPLPSFWSRFPRTTSVERDHRGPLPLVPSSLQTQIQKGIPAAWDTELGLVEARLGAPSWDYFK